MTAQDVIRALRGRHPDLSGEWLTYAECFRIDFFAMHTWSSRRHTRVGYEVKVSRGDFLTEMKKPGKRMNAVDLCHEFYFATPAEMVQPDEIPDDCGLVWVYDSGRTRTKVMKRAPRTDARPFTDDEVVYLARFQLWKDGVADMANEVSNLRRLTRYAERDRLLQEDSTQYEILEMRRRRVAREHDTVKVAVSRPAL